MSREIAGETEEYIQKMRKRKRNLDKNALIWITAILLSIAFITIGVLDFNADYTSTQTGSPLSREEIKNVDGTDYSVTVTYLPIYGSVNLPNVDADGRHAGGFLPDIGMTIHDWIILSIIFLIGMPSVLIYQVEGRRLNGIDNAMPFLLREIADSQRIGMTLPRAIAEASKRNYGPLTENLKKLAAKISWGIPFRDAMKTFRDSIDTPLSRQATILILEAERSGGELEKIFDSAQNYVQELLDIKREREASIQPYIYIIFVSYLIFAIVVYVLFTTFFAPFGVRTITSDTGQEVIPVPIEAFKVGFLYMLAIQGFFSGLVAGKMGKGSVKLGLYYSTIMMAIGLIIHKFFIVTGVESIQNEAQGITPEG